MRKSLPRESGVPTRIVDSAETLFAQLGLQGCSLRRIAAAAGTSESGVLRFFDTKEDIFLSVMERSLGVLLERIERATVSLGSEADAISRLLCVSKTVYGLYRTEPDKVALIFSECGLSIRMLRGAEGRTLMSLPGMTRLVSLITDLFQQGLREGTMRAVDPIAAREAFFGILEGTILGWLLASDPSSSYKSASPAKSLVVIERMLRGLQ